MKSAQDFSTEGTLSFDRDVINSVWARPSQKLLNVRKFSIKSGIINYWYQTLNPKEMRVNACDVRYMVCVPTLNWRCKEQCECCKGFSLFQKNFFCSIQIRNKEELTLSLPSFWHICFLSATYILTTTSYHIKLQHSPIS